MVFSATFNNISAISWRSILFVGEIGENHWPASQWQTGYLCLRGIDICLKKIYYVKIVNVASINIYNRPYINVEKILPELF